MYTHIYVYVFTKNRAGQVNGLFYFSLISRWFVLFLVNINLFVVFPCSNWPCSPNLQVHTSPLTVSTSVWSFPQDTINAGDPLYISFPNLVSRWLGSLLPCPSLPLAPRTHVHKVPLSNTHAACRCTAANMMIVSPPNTSSCSCTQACTCWSVSVPNPRTPCMPALKVHMLSCSVIVIVNPVHATSMVVVWHQKNTLVK